MCEYCGCKGVAPIGELMEEHVALLDEAERVRVALASGDRDGALDAAIGGLDAAAPDFEQRLTQLFDELAAHIEREDLGIFPVSVVTLGATGWELVERAHGESPSFLAVNADRPSLSLVDRVAEGSERR